jgi:hypothetical protein
MAYNGVKSTHSSFSIQKQQTPILYNLTSTTSQNYGRSNFTPIRAPGQFDGSWYYTQGILGVNNNISMDE